MNFPRRLLSPLAALAIASVVGPVSAIDLSGSWSGVWESCTTGHTGPLRADFTRCGTSQYRVDFAGRFFKILPFRYSVTLDVVEDCGDRVVLAGSSFLGRLFGTFTYQATADGCRFSADYRSKKDSGEFRLTRVAGR
jgi:hypothetical protein